MVKYHINSRGTTSICRAKISCPLGASFSKKEEALQVAEREKNEFVKLDKEYSKKAKNTFEENLDKRNFRAIEAEMDGHNSESLKNVYSQIQEERNKPGTLLEKKNKIIQSSNKVFAKKKKRSEEIKSTMKEDLKEVQAKEKEVKRLEKVIENQKIQVKEHNEAPCPKCGKGKMVKRSGRYGEFLACNKFPSCRHTDRPAYVNPATIKKLKNAEHAFKLEEQNLNQKVEKIQKEDPQIIALDEQLETHRKKAAILEYINSYENPKGGYKSRITPIEEYYEKRKAGDEKIKKKLGVTKVAINSKGLSFGANEINEKLTVDSKGRINNLYMEDPNNLGEVKRVVKFHENASGNIEFEDGSTTTISTSTNYKVDGLAKVPSGIKFYTTKSRSKKEYSGYNKLILNNFDSGD